MTDFAFNAPSFAPVDRRMALGTAASVGLHLAILAVIILASPLRQLVVLPPQPVAVEIVTQQQVAALQQPAPAPVPPVLAAPSPSTEAAPPVAGERLTPSGPLQPDLPENKTITATQFYSANILREPGMEHIRKALGTLVDSERVVQLCNIEGLEQIRRAEPKYDPDTLVPYAMADMDGSGLTLIASGGAFRSRRKWYGVTFKCTAAADYSGITAFAFKLGDPIPQDEWEEHNLNLEDSDE